MHAQFKKNHEKVPEMVLVRRQGFKKQDFGAKWVPKKCKMDQNGSQSGPKSPKLAQNGAQKPPKVSQNDKGTSKKEPCGKVSIFDAKRGRPPTIFGSHFGPFLVQNT